MSVRLKQFWKASLPIDVSCEFSPNVTSVRLEQSLKVSYSIDVTPLGISMLARLEQL